MKHFSESVQSGCVLLGIALHLYSNDSALLPDNEIYFVITVAPVEYLEAVNESLADKITAYALFVNPAPSLYVHDGFFVCVRVERRLQGIVVHLEFGNTGTPAGRVYAIFLQAA